MAAYAAATSDKVGDEEEDDDDEDRERTDDDKERDERTRRGRQTRTHRTTGLNILDEAERTGEGWGGRRLKGWGGGGT